MKAGALAAGVAFLAAGLPAAARAQAAAIPEEQRAQIETLRGEIAAQIQLQAYDLIDELVYGWTVEPPFAVDTPTVLADVGVPVGFGSGMQALIENHFASVIVANPRSRVTLSHCPQCTAMVVHSGLKGTIVSRGVDEPEALAAAGALSGAKHALFLDFEAEGSALVLRARITSLEAALPIVYAKTLSTTTSSPALLRSPDHLKSAAEARQEYADALRGLSSYAVPFRIGVRSYAQGSGSVAVPPFIWLQAGIEGAFTQARAWTGELSFGYSYAPELHNAFMVEGRVSRLLSGSTTSLTHPDLYLYFSVAAFDVRGVDALAFQGSTPTTQDILNTAIGNNAEQAFGSFDIGLELRVKNRIAAGVFVESLPALASAPAIGNYFNVGVPFQCIGGEVSFWL